LPLLEALPNPIQADDITGSKSPIFNISCTEMCGANPWDQIING
jgi:hypothetical protein